MPTYFPTTLYIYIYIYIYIYNILYIYSKIYIYFHLALERDLDRMDLREIESDEKHYTRVWHKISPRKSDISNNLSEFCPSMITALVMKLKPPLKFLQGGIVLKNETIKDYFRSTISQEHFSSSSLLFLENETETFKL